MRESLAIADTDTSTRLYDKLAVLGARLIVDTLGSFLQLNAQVQSTEGVTYAAKILKEEALIDWRQPASVLSQRIRAFDPFPGAHTVLNHQTLKVWSASALTEHTHATHGTVLRLHADALDVACGQGVLRIHQLQRPGGKRIGAAEFLHSQPVTIGWVLGEASH